MGTWSHLHAGLDTTLLLWGVCVSKKYEYVTLICASCVIEFGVNVQVLNGPVASQNLKHNETCTFYGKTNNTLLRACETLQRRNLTDQIFCNAQTKKCYAFLLPQQLQNKDYYGLDTKNCGPFRNYLF